jgi:hypothetical protein
MYCPQCGQHQASTEMRFCSRCGFPMSGVVELLASGGLLPMQAMQGAHVQPVGDSPRRLGVRQGVMMMLVGAVLVPILGILASFTPGDNLLELLIPITAVVCFAGGLMRILYATFFEQGASSIKTNNATHVAPTPPIATPQLKAEARVSALPPQREQPAAASFFTPPRRLDTAELVQPPSVTENTTRLLDEDKAARNE